MADADFFISEMIILTQKREPGKAIDRLLSTKNEYISEGILAQLVALSGRFHLIQKKFGSGVLSYREYELLTSKIIEELLQILTTDIKTDVSEQRNRQKINYDLDYSMFSLQEEIKLKIKIEDDFNIYKLRDIVRISDFLKKMTERTDDLKIVEITPGSINVTFSMSENSFMKLLVNIDNNKLKKLGITDIKLVTAQKENTAPIASIQSNNFRITNIKTVLKSMLTKELKQGLKNLEIIILPQSSKVNELLTITSTFSKIEEKHRTGQIDNINHLSELGKITYATLGLIDSLASEDINFDSFS